MSSIAGLWIWNNYLKGRKVFNPDELILPLVDSPISVRKVLRFGALFVAIQIGGTLLTKLVGGYGIIATGIVAVLQAAPGPQVQLHHGQPRKQFACLEHSCKRG